MTGAETGIAPYVPVQMDGIEEEDLQIPRLHVYHAMGSEIKKYGKHNHGSAINSLTGEEIGEAEDNFQDYDLPPCVVLRISSSYQAWGEELGSRPIYQGKTKAWVEANHPKHLEWGSGKPDKGVGLKAVKIIEAVVLFEGQNMPTLVCFKEQSIKTGQSLITMLKARRDDKSTYIVSVTSKSNGDNTWYLLGRIRTGPAPSEALLTEKSSWVGKTLSTSEDLPEECAVSSTDAAFEDVRTKDEIPF